MQRIVILLLGTACLVASGVIKDQGRMGSNSKFGLGLQTTQGLNGDFGLGVNTLTRDELLRQKFILDILQQVHKPLQQQDLVILDDSNTVTNENLYMRPLTQEMLLVLDLIRDNQVLGKQTVCRISNEQHIRQMVGLYRLFVNARNFDSFKRLVVYARQNINTEMFVNCLILALGERNDTKMLIVPALYEVLPQLFHQDQIIDQVRQLDTGISSVRPQLVDVVGMGRQNRFLNSYISNQQSGLLGVLNQSQLFMPWRQLQNQLAFRKTMGGNVMQQNEQQMDKMIVSLSGNGLLSQDLDLKAYVNILINELIVSQDNIKNANTNQIKMGDRYFGGMGKYIRNNDNNDYDVNSQRRNIFGGLNRNRNEGRGMGDETETRDIYGNMKRENYDDEFLMEGRRNGQDMNRNIQFGRRNFQEENKGINTVNVNDDRLLFVGRRHQNANSRIQYGDDEVISGGRRVSYDKNERQGSMYNYDNEDFYNTERINNERLTNQERYMKNNNDNQNDFRRNFYMGQGVGMGGDRDDFLDIIARGRVGQKQSLYNDKDTMFNQGYMGRRNSESLDMNLPTTSFDDERLLRINRNKLNNIDEDRRINNGQRGFNYEDVEDRINQRGNFGSSRLDEEIMGQRYNMDISRRGYNDNNENKRGSDNTSGRRYRRSLIDQDQVVGQNDAITGKFLLHTLQQLVARLNVERIALGQPQLIDTQTNMGRGLINFAGRVTINRNEVQGVDFQTVNKIEKIIQRIDQVLEQKIGQITVMSYNQKINEIGLLLAGQVQDIGLIEIFGELFQQSGIEQQQGLLANIIENEAAQILLAGIVKVVDNKVQQVFKQREEFISNVRGVTINNVDVDHLQTYLEYADIDLSNVLKSDFDQTVRGNDKVVVGRVPRINHEDFTIEIDVTSDRQQQVIVRNLLVPKVDGQGKIIPLEDKRQNVIVLDIATVKLQQGRNTLKLKSNEITMTARDTTPLTKIYKQVMQALNGESQLQEDLLVGQSNLLPHRLLLPRGRKNGLSMQLITVITPVEQTKGTNVNGLAALLFDRLPLNYPLHCDITDLDRIISMSNLLVKDVKINHNDNNKMSSMQMY